MISELFTFCDQWALFLSSSLPDPPQPARSDPLGTKLADIDATPS